MNPSLLNNNETASTGTLFNEVAQLKSIKQPNKNVLRVRPPKIKELKKNWQANYRNWRASLQQSNQKLHELFLYTFKKLQNSLIKS